ncbi:catalase [Trichonephila clavipes]|nr:catalase [Trichonephila clavipes]
MSLCLPDRALLVKLFYQIDNSAIVALRRFRTLKGLRKGPLTAKYLRLMVTKFEETGSLNVRSGRGKKPVSVEAIEKVALQVEEDKSSNVLASTSVRRVQEALDLPCSTVQKIMRNILRYYPYKLQFVQELLPHDFETRHLFSLQFLARLEVDPEWPWNILWTDEAHFHLDGAGGPVSCSITGQRYASLLRNKIIPDLQARQCLSRITFMQDGAPPHITRCVTDVLKHHFTEERVISRQFRHLWPPRLPDLNPCDFWLWGHLKQLDPDMTWDFFSLRPETTYQVMWLFSDRGIPHSHRHMNGYGSNTFKLVNSNNESVYCKFHYMTDQGIKNRTNEEAQKVVATDPDFATRDLYNAIANQQFPSWTMYIQVMTFEQAKNWQFNPFDVTKVWPKKEFPLIKVGKFTLNRNPKNYFAEVEQLAFPPSDMVPGIEPSPDKMLQGRLFAYADTQRYRLGANYLQIPVNCPYRTRSRNYERDGPDTVTDNQDGAPNYYPNSFSGPVNDPDVREPPFEVSGDVDRWNSEDEDNFTQAKSFYRKTLTEAERGRLIQNLASNLVNAQEFLQERALRNFTQVDDDFGKRLKKELEKLKVSFPFCYSILQQQLIAAVA